MEIRDDPDAGRYRYDILPVCQEVHMGLCRTSEAKPNIHRLVEWLRMRLMEWFPSREGSPWEPFEQAVKRMVEATIAEADDEINRGVMEWSRQFCEREASSDGK